MGIGVIALFESAKSASGLLLGGGYDFFAW